MNCAQSDSWPSRQRIASRQGIVLRQRIASPNRRNGCGKLRDPRRGSALLAVLWLSLALTAIAFALSRSVRTEYDRAALNVDSTRAYFLAQAGIEAALLRIGPGRFDPTFQPGQRLLQLALPGGVVEVEILGENGKLSVRTAPPEALARLFTVCNIDPAQAADLAAQIVEARSGGFSGGASSFSAAGASLHQLEDLLRVPGMTPGIFYGTYREERAGLVRVGGLRPHLTFESGGMINANYASRELLLAAGLPDPAVHAIEQIRRQRPLRMDDPGMETITAADSVIRLGLGGSPTAYTLRATARLSNGRTTRTVAAGARSGVTAQFPWEIVRWHDIAD
jgi:general secretion pathway protein K